MEISGVSVAAVALFALVAGFFWAIGARLANALMALIH